MSGTKRRPGSEGAERTTLRCANRWGEEAPRGPSLTVRLAVLRSVRRSSELLKTYGDDQGFFVHFVHGSMVSLTISPTRGGND